MKTKALLFMFFGLMGLLVTSCSSDGGGDEPTIEVTGITIDQQTASMEVEASLTLEAALQPAGAEGDIAWSSSDPSVAPVNNGIVTGLKSGSATIVATYGAYTASCEVTVTPKIGELDASLKGSNYTIIQIGEASFTAIQDKVVNDLRPDDTNKFLYIWDGTFTGGTPTGLNFYEQSEGWPSFVVGSAGWSGAGYSISADYQLIDMTDMYNNPDNYVFHIALKSSQASSSYLFIFADGAAEAKICIGSAAYEDGGVTYEPFADFARDGEWHEIEIPASKFRELGVFYNEPFNDKNVFAFLAGGVQGTTLDYDACFFYKKAN
ncbi:Ig-like domain-containing protein [Plebeiibacterium sediminum]|uniref:Ig-like domain-containing protein n=1 Tax=Plebeiibacterium sediminum TaxID=2992112 RepID=A0AAE3M2R8_9BACT|nr:Ig-like domain-containing protein [Plebeiobacterium sediminum]MCW3785772.1 Ig-like domain-containing protein [Plebeiobacterium sediminum]